jgi:succinyl-CoA synthetase alpha subunit
MSILIDKNTRVLVQGITGRDGSFHAKGMLDYGTQVVGGVTPGKGGEQVHGIPVFNSGKEASPATQANATVIYVPAKFAAGAVREAADAGHPPGHHASPRGFRPWTCWRCTTMCARAASH